MSIQITSVTKDTGITITPDISTSTLYAAGQVFTISAPSGYKISEIDYGVSTAKLDTISVANATLSSLLPYVDTVPNASTITFTLPPQTVPGTAQHYKIVIKKVLVQVYFKSAGVDAITSNPTINAGTLYDPGTSFTLTAPTGYEITSIVFYDYSKAYAAGDILEENNYAECNFKGSISTPLPSNSAVLTLPDEEGKIYKILVSTATESSRLTKTTFETLFTDIEYRALTSSNYANRFLFPVTVQVGKGMWGAVEDGIEPTMRYTFNDMANISKIGEGADGWRWSVVNGRLSAFKFDWGGVFEKPKGYIPYEIGPYVFTANLNRAPVPYTTWFFSFSFGGGFIIFNICHNGSFISVFGVSSVQEKEGKLLTIEFICPPSWDFKEILLFATTSKFNNPTYGSKWTMVMGTKDWDEGAMERYIVHRHVTDEMIQEVIDKNQVISREVVIEVVDGVLYIDAPPEEVTAMAGKYYEKQINTDDCNVVTWEIASQDIPGSPLTINSTGFVSGAIPLTVPPGDYTVVIKATNSVGSVRFLTLSITVTEYDVSDTWEVLGSTATAIRYVLHHSDDYYLLVDSNRYIYKTTDFITYDTVYDAGLTTRGFTRPHELADKTVLLGMSKAGSNPTYVDTYTLLSDTGCTAFTERPIYESQSTGGLTDMIISTSDATHAIAAIAVSNKTYMLRIKISDGSRTTVVSGAVSSGDKKRLWNMEVAGAGTAPWDKLIFNNVGTAGQPGDNDIWSTLNATNWTVEFDGGVSNGTNSAPTNKIFYKSTNGYWYVKNNTAIYTSADAGDTWTLVNAGVAQDILNPVFLMATDDLFLQAESGTTNGRVYKSKDACVNFTVNYTLTNGAKPVILYKDWKGRVLLVTTGTTDNILRAA